MERTGTTWPYCTGPTSRLRLLGPDHRVFPSYGWGTLYFLYMRLKL